MLLPLASPFADFITRLYSELVLPLAIPVGVLALLIAGVAFMAGNRRGVEMATQVLLGVVLIGFGPFIINWLYTTASSLGGR